MDETIKYSVAGIILAFMLYILEVRLNGVYWEGHNRDKELSFLKQRNQQLEMKVETSKDDMSSLRTTVEKLVKEIDGIKNTPTGNYKMLFFDDYKYCFAVLLFQIQNCKQNALVLHGKRC